MPQALLRCSEEWWGAGTQRAGAGGGGCRYNPIKTAKTSFMGTMNMLGLAKRTKVRSCTLPAPCQRCCPRISPVRQGAACQDRRVVRLSLCPGAVWDGVRGGWAACPSQTARSGSCWAQWGSMGLPRPALPRAYLWGILSGIDRRLSAPGAPPSRRGCAAPAITGAASRLSRAVRPSHRTCCRAGSATRRCSRRGGRDHMALLLWF